uniref:Uncharacterized protein n=1 Tax=Avena sativa TaxID=4498 RepID=A0ACD5XC45_AVESA
MPLSMDTPPRTSASNGDGAKPHVLFVPYPAQGHMLPLLDLAALLDARGLAVTVALTAANARHVAASCPSVATVVLPFPSSPLLPAGCAENTKGLPTDLLRPFTASFAALSAPLLSWCKAQPLHRSVTTIVSDLFTGWTVPIAKELAVPHVAFWPGSVLYLATSHSLWRRMPTRRRPDEDDDDDDSISFPDVPGSPSFPWRHLSWMFRMHVPGDEVSETIRQIFLWNLESSYFVANSFSALEPAFLDRDRPLPDLMRKRVLAVGMLSEAVSGCGCINRGEKPALSSVLAAWLDAFDEGSVLYVCFGTQKALSPAQVACMADALARSSAGFVWVVTSGTVLPEGFEPAMAPRGMVIREWAPQVEILRHRAVGWFLTHCGWNSALEAAAAGVAMLTWPMSADQFTNAWQFAKAGVAVPIAEGADAVPDAGEMANTIAALVVAKEGASVRERALELSRKVAAAVAKGGTSNCDLDEFVCMLTAAA